MTTVAFLVVWWSMDTTVRKHNQAFQYMSAKESDYLNYSHITLNLWDVTHQYTALKIKLMIEILIYWVNVLQWCYNHYKHCFWMLKWPFRQVLSTLFYRWEIWDSGAMNVSQTYSTVKNQTQVAFTIFYLSKKKKKWWAAKSFRRFFFFLLILHLSGRTARVRWIQAHLWIQMTTPIKAQNH